MENKPTIKGENARNCLKLIVRRLDERKLVYNPKELEFGNIGIIIRATVGSDNCKSFFLSARRYRHPGDYNYITYWSAILKKFWVKGSTPSQSALTALYESGFSRYDMEHIIGLSDPTIRKKAKLGVVKEIKYETKKTLKKVPIYYELKKTRDEYRSDFWGKIWGLKKTITWVEKIQYDYEFKDVEEKIEVGEELTFNGVVDYRDLNNFSKYIRAWLSLF